MKSNQIKKATKNMSFESANHFIENCGLELILISNSKFSKMWDVKNNKEITHICNDLYSLTDNKSDVKFVFNY